MKIGLITLSRYNFGSALQCFSSQRYIEDNYCDCEVIEKKKDGEFISYLQTLIEISYKCITHPFSIRAIISQFMAQRSSGLRLSDKSLREIERFNLCNIDISSYHYKELKTIAKSDKYQLFFSGSDQVWNGARINNYAMFFLRFAPQKKRIAWAPSFGSKEISSYNRRLYNKYISQFHSISVREKSGAKIINQLIGEEAGVLCDPVILFSGEQWREFYIFQSSFNIEMKYICLFFIDSVSEKTLEFIKNLSEQKGIRTVSFGYYYDCYRTLKKHIHCDGSPFDFLKCLDNADTIVTDSFHATVFSTLFKKDFYTFTRNYIHAQDQSARITDLLGNINAMDRFDSSIAKPPMDFTISETYFKKEREKMDVYLERNLGCKKHNRRKIPLYTSSSDCCGCGACVDICPKNAIMLSNAERGYLPVINWNVCVNCGMCLKVCGMKKLSEGKKVARKAYVGRGKDEKVIQSSASGGVFASIAQQFINNGGIVYGAALIINKGICDCKHIRVDKTDDLQHVLNSKYVQSRTDGIYKEVREDLMQGKKVLFSGTSCQVASLNTYLENRLKTNLYTIDLICHGVPSIDLLQDYVDYIQKVKKAKVVNLQFRNKNNQLSPFAPYIMTLDLQNENEMFTEYIPLRDSSYYRLFMNMVAYRYSCYNCKFATIDKPADITLGDYYFSDNQYLPGNLLVLDKEKYYSCIICQTNKGMSLLKESNIDLYEITCEEAVSGHNNLQSASFPTRMGIKLYEIYRSKGFTALQKYIDKQNKFIDCVKKIRKMK